MLKLCSLKVLKATRYTSLIVRERGDKAIGYPYNYPTQNPKTQ
jgi:hypothetical protein